MSKFVNLTMRSLRPNGVRVPIFFALIIASVVSFWFVVAPRADAGSNCDLCHKKVDTISVVCFGLDWRRHKDHGDTDGPCSATTSRPFLSPKHQPALKPGTPHL